MVLSKLLLSAGADVNSQCMGCSPFSYAIRFGCVGLVDLYIQHGASVLAASGDENAFFPLGQGALAMAKCKLRSLLCRGSSPQGIVVSKRGLLCEFCIMLLGDQCS